MMTKSAPLGRDTVLGLRRHSVAAGVMAATDVGGEDMIGEERRRLKKQMISLAVPNGLEPCSVEALCAGGLALHKTKMQTLKLSAGSHFYTITHIASGGAIFRILWTKKAALNALHKLLAADVDWTLSTEQLKQKHGLDRFRELLAAVKA